MVQPQLICVVGPTACGKTTLGVLIAKKFSGEVVSVDSMQIYKNMAVGTAAPSPAEMDGVPHHMIGVANPAEHWSVARFAQAADTCIQDILSRRKLPVLVGGSGLYMDAVISGRCFAPGCAASPVRRVLQSQLETSGIEPLLAELKQVDPDSASKLHPADVKRILRALEVYRLTGKTISQFNRDSQERPKRYAPVYIGLTFRNREDLKTFIDQRVDKMLSDGLLDEVRALLDAGVPRSSTALQAIGYKELLPVLDGVRTLHDAAGDVKLRSRQYAKRQLTWLRRNPDIHWVYWEKERDFAAALQIVTEILAAVGIQ